MNKLQRHIGVIHQIRRWIAINIFGYSYGPVTVISVDKRYIKKVE